MLIWIQVIFFVITNAPKLIAAIRELIKIFRGDKDVARSVLQDLKDAKANPQVGTDMEKQMSDIIDGYKNGTK